MTPTIARVPGLQGMLEAETTLGALHFSLSYAGNHGADLHQGHGFRTADTKLGSSRLTKAVGLLFWDLG